MPGSETKPACRGSPPKPVLGSGGPDWWPEANHSRTLETDLEPADLTEAGYFEEPEAAPPKHPPCVDAERCPACASVCETSSACKTLGSVGSEAPLGVPRRTLMHSGAALALAAFALTVYACCALSPVAGVVRNTAWAVGHVKGENNAKLYLGLVTIAGYFDNDRVYESRWKSIDCDDYFLPSELDYTDETKPDRDVDRCERCKKRALGMGESAIVSALTSLTTARIDLSRASRDRDSNCLKVMGVIMGLVSFSTALSALLGFRAHCAQVSTHSFRMRNGPGFYAISVATFLKGMSILGNLALKAPPRRQRPPKMPTPPAGSE